jgi:uncharacterized membrane protein
MIPDWLPNIHPLIIHFPIALIVTAVLLDIAKFFFREQNWLQKAILLLYSIGTLGLIASFLSGRQAVETVSVSGDAVPVVTSHEDWALYTLIFFALFTLLKFWSWKKNLEINQSVSISLVILAFVGTGMLWYTGEKGARLVYDHGVGVGEINRLEERIDALQNDLNQFMENAAPDIRDDGSWSWRIAPGSDEILADYFTLENFDDVDTKVAQEDNRHHLELSGAGEQAFLLIDNNLTDIEGRIEINLADFDGQFMLVHHYQNPETYQYLRTSGSELEQGQMLSGSDSILGSGAIESDGWNTFRVTTSGAHYYGYQNENTIVHTHDDEMEPGKTGFAFTGSGDIKIRMIEFRAVN